MANWDLRKHSYRISWPFQLTVKDCWSRNDAKCTRNSQAKLTGDTTFVKFTTVVNFDKLNIAPTV